MVTEHTSDITELRQKARMWQDILGLRDWNITVEVRRWSDMECEDYIGQNELDVVNKVSAIYILDERDYGARPMRMCAEKVLVHEMLHCLCNWVAPSDTFEGRYVDVMEHRRLEELARGFIMAKYGVTAEWFWK